MLAGLGGAAACGPLSRSPVAEATGAGTSPRVGNGEAAGTTSPGSSDSGGSTDDGGGGSVVGQQPSQSTGTGTGTGTSKANGSSAGSSGSSAGTGTGTAPSGAGTGNGGKVTTGNGNGTATKPEEPTQGNNSPATPTIDCAAPGGAASCGCLLATLNTERLALCAGSGTPARVTAAALPARQRCGMMADDAAVTSCDALPPAADSDLCLSSSEESCAQTRLRVKSSQAAYCQQTGPNAEPKGYTPASLKQAYQAAAQRLTGCCLDSLVLPSLDACPEAEPAT